MPIATLTFQLPEESEEHQLALDGVKYKMVIDEFNNWLRELEKHQGISAVTISETRAKLAEIQSGQGINQG